MKGRSAEAHPRCGWAAVRTEGVRACWCEWRAVKTLADKQPVAPFMAGLMIEINMDGRMMPPADPVRMVDPESLEAEA